MAKLNWNKQNRYEKVDHYADAIERNQLNAKKDLNLGKHEHHDWQVVLKPTGPHSGKIICNTCGGKFVTWLPKGFL